MHCRHCNDPTTWFATRSIGRSVVDVLDLATPTEWTERQANFANLSELDGRYLSNSIPQHMYSVAYAKITKPNSFSPTPRPTNINTNGPAESVAVAATVPTTPLKITGSGDGFDSSTVDVVTRCSHCPPQNGRDGKVSRKI
ncbi:Hypothetical protein CINCED_3A022854 [Cinara cedri]|uniref:Uncharacterized protein n=1 Tax=Cinara cedri TaxID=506608 RepID=A0A5E4N822_9HEMI|nr:Hypothetical protein CINCED_3A022854 [Cinara cedri]